MRIKITENQLNKIISEAISKMTAYHYSNADFNNFDLGFVNTGNKMQSYGYGIYVAMTQDAAKYYGKIGYVVEIPKNPNKYIIGTKTYSKAFCAKILNQLYSYILSTTDIYNGAENELRMELNSIIDEYDGLNIYGTVESYLGSDKEASEFFEKLGYYGIRYADKRGFEIAVIFNPKNIKIIKKTKS